MIRTDAAESRPTDRPRATPIAIAAAILFQAPFSSADLLLRDGRTITLPIEVVSIEGVTVRSDAGTRSFGWHEIRAVDGPRSGDAELFMPLADSAWRAGIRLRRGDLDLAAPLYEQLFDQLRAHEGPTALHAAEGTLHTRLAARNLALAVEPWSRIISMISRADPSEQRAAPSEALSALIDPRLLLCPALPPFFTPEQARAVLDQPAISGAVARDEASAPESPGASPTTDPAPLMLAWYRRAATADADRTPAPVASAPASEHPGAKFLADLTLARTSPDPKERAIRRARLELELDPNIDTWREAWSRAAIGLSLIEDGTEESLILGALQLLHIPARFETTQPQLAGLALAHAADALDRAGLAPQATKLRRELRARFPHHPAIAMLPIHGSGPATGSTPAFESPPPIDANPGNPGTTLP
ncbi:MAG: hypothetical protein ACTS3F_03410 [Phycisphaerales bacterium]